jgi:Spy/CpxP family protein refolding chaperone
MRRVLKIGLPVLAAVLVAGATALAAGGFDHPHHGPAMFRKHVSERVDAALDAARVSPEQRAAIHASRDKMFAAMEEPGRGAEHRADMEQLLSLFEAERIDTAQVQALRARHEARMQRHAEAITQAVVEAHGVLTPAQRRAVVEHVREERAGFLARHAERAGHGFMKQMISHRVDEALDAAKASPEQRAAIHAAVEHVATEMQEAFKDHHADMQAALALFAENEIDPARVAAVRAEQLGRARRVGDAMVQAFHDIHDALTTAQRQQVAAWARAQAQRFHHPPAEAAPPSE